MPATPVRDIELIEIGSLGKETLSNDAFLNLSHGISGAATIALAATDHTLTTTNDGEAMRFVLILVGVLTANVNVIVPTESRVYVVDNRTTGAFTVTFRPAAGGGVAVDQSARTLIYCDSSNVYPVASGTGGGGGSGAPTDASYLVGASHTLLSGERVVTNTPTISWDLTTAGQAKGIIPPDAVTYSHIQNVTAGRLLGRDTASAGDVQEITLGTGLAMSAGGVLSATGGGGGQPLDATLTALAGLATGANQLPYATGTDTFAQTPLTAFARTVLDDADAATVRGTIAAQASDATLTALAGVTTGADMLPFFTGIDTASTTTLTAFMRGLLDDPDLATAQATLGITGGGGSTTLLGLTDVPDTYTGQATKVLAVRADETGTEFVTPAAGGSYTDEQAQDAVGAMLADTVTIALAYADATPALTASVLDGSITEAKLSLSDVTTKDASTTAHGLLRKLSGTATQYLDGSGAWTTPAGGTNYWSRTAEIATLATAFAAWWKLDEASSTRVDSIAGLSMTPIGGANLTQVAGKIGNAVGMNGTAGTYLTMTNTAAVQMSTTTSLTVMAWVYLTSLTACAYISKGNAGANASYEYLLQLHTTNKFRFAIANGTTVQNLDDTGPTPTLNAWHLVIGWLDQASGTLNLQVDNGTVISAAATTTSYASTHPCEIGRWAGWSGSPSLNGRQDMTGIAKRVLTTTERSQLWNSGAGLDHPFGTAAGFYVAPLTTADSLLLGATRTSTERLEVDGAIKVGQAVGTTDGTLRWSGTDMEARKGGAWVSMTAGAGGQPLDATLTALAGLATGADQLPYATGTDTFAQTPLTTFARTLLDDTTQAAMRTTLALTPGTDVQAQDAELQAIAGLTSAADRLPYFTGLGTASLATLTAFARTVLDDVDAATMRTTLGAAQASVVQPLDATLTALAALGTGADQLPYFTGTDTAAQTPFTAAGRTLAGAADAAAQRTTLGLGTLAQQDAATVAITGGTAKLSHCEVGNIINTAVRQAIEFDKAGGSHGLVIHGSGADTGGYHALFFNAAASIVGTISTTASATAYNTSSDARLKHAITAIAGALAVVQALRPVGFRWNADESQGHGFLAHELQQVVPDAVSGQPDEVNEDGSVRPQQVDHSRLVPWLTACCQELAQQVQALQARVATLEGAMP